MLYIQNKYAPAASGRLTIFCYVLDICDLDGMETDLPPTEKIAPIYMSKAQKVHSRNKVLAELGVGILLARTLAITTDDAISIDAYGKPFLTSGDRKIGITHAGNLVVLAISGCAVGIDVEPLPDTVNRNHRAALERAYGSRLEKFEDFGDTLTPHLFAELWTRVEAAVKLDGRGLRLDPRENFQIFDGVHFHAIEYKRHIITVATYEPSTIKILPFAP